MSSFFKANLYVEELDNSGEIEFATWCTGIVFEGNFYGIQKSSSNLLKNFEIIKIPSTSCNADVSDKIYNLFIDRTSITNGSAKAEILEFSNVSDEIIEQIFN